MNQRDRTETGRRRGGALGGRWAGPARWLFAVWIATGGSSAAQTTSGLKASDYTFSDYYPAPNHRQLRYHLSGGELQPNADTKAVTLRKVQLQTYRTNGEPELVITAPECEYDPATRVVRSGGKLTVQSGDGKLRVTGEGFFCPLTDKSLIISNDVQATIQRPLTNAPANPLVVTSDWFEFGSGARRVVFHDNVHGEDLDVEFTCGQLAVSASTSQRAFDLVEAEGQLNITGKADQRRASADRGVYRRTEDRIDLSGNAQWFVGWQGRADRVTAFRKDNSYEAEGHVALQLPRAALGAAGGLLNTASNAPTANPAAMVAVTADRFTSRSNHIVASGQVHVRDAGNELTCAQLESIPANAATGQGESALASGGVRVTRGPGFIESAQAVYTKAGRAVTFTGDPHWQQEQLEGRARRVIFRDRDNSVDADEDVAVTVTLDASSGSPLKFFGEDPGPTGARVIGITAKKLAAKAGKAVFTGDVQAHQMPVTGNEPRLHSDKLEVRFASAARRVTDIIAATNVVYEQGAAGVTNGPYLYRRMTSQTTAARIGEDGALAELTATGGVRVEQPDSVARGDRAIYTRRTDILQLLGQPVIERADVNFSADEELIWDNAHQRLMSTGYRINVPEAALKRAGESKKLP